MEQAVNQFNKGLQSDTHPIVQGNDTLSDALNATLVTMNGNEVVLQNDMGNRRVDNAFLPSGYEPVGIKEYGGIIYVAAYNPITNRSQIGSFPSPERKINSLDDKSLGTEFNFFDSFSLSEELNNERRFISTDTVMLPLTGETSLHAGDKFIIYSDEIREWKDCLSNCYNTLGNNIIVSQKNKHITLYAGVLNSQNQFVDITKTLKRWKNGEIVKYDESYSDDYIFNDGYFINDSIFEGDSSKYAIDDRQLIKERQVKPANTYAYKLTGPLYLKAQLNHIQEFSFNINGDKDKSCRKLNLIITANITYNCPDGEGNNYIEQYDGYTRHAFDFYIEENGQYVKKIMNYKYSDPIYINDVYRRTITANITINCSRDFDYDGILKYFIGVDSGIPLKYTQDRKSYYIETLSQYGELDLSKLNSGYIGLKAFRFFNSNRTTTITYITETYPKLEQIFSNFKLGIKNLDSEEERIIPVSDTLLNGKGIFSFDWDQLEERKLYKVYFYYDDNQSGTNKKLLDSRWLLTTQLFNDCYNPTSPNFVEDYQEKIYSPNAEDYSVIQNAGEPTITYNTRLYEKLKLNFEIVNNSNVINTKYDTTTSEGKLIDKKSIDIINYKTIDSCNIRYQLSDYIDILDEELFPTMTLINNKLSVTNNIQIDKSNLKIEYVKNGKIYTLDENTDVATKSNFNDLIETITQTDENVLNITIKYKNMLYSADMGGSNKSVNNGFYNLNSENFKRDVLKNSISNSGFFIANKDRYKGPDDYHLYGIVLDSKKYSLPLRIESDFDEHSKYFNDEDDDEKHLDFNDQRIRELYSTMDDIPNKYTFAFIFSAINMVGTGRPLAYVYDILDDGWAGFDGQHPSGSNIGYCPITCCKVWWRNGIADEWVLLNNKNGVFGGTNSEEYKFPSKQNEKYIFIGNNEDWQDGNYIGLNIYNNLYENNNDIEINGHNIKGNIRNMVIDQITNFLDPNKEIVYNIYKVTNLYDNNLRTIDKNDYLYNKPYSGDIIVNIGYNIPEFNVINKDLLYYSNDKIYIRIDNNVLKILPFHANNIIGPQYRKVSIPIKSNEEFEDDINNIISNDVINNIYLENGTFRDINYNQLSGDTIYKIVKKDEEFKGLKPLNNPPYKVYKDTGLNFNSLVSISNYTGSSVPQSQYLRAEGDEDSKMSLKFSGGNLRTVEYTKFKNLS